MKEKILYIKANWTKEKSLPFFVATFLYTSVLIVTLLIDFFSKKFFTPDWAVIVYSALLSAYVFSKEVGDRWILGIKWIPRMGQVFVYIWVGMSLGMYLGEYISHGLYHTPPSVVNTTITVISLYLISITSKYLYNKKEYKLEFDTGYGIMWKETQIKSGKNKYSF